MAGHTTQPAVSPLGTLPLFRGVPEATLEGLEREGAHLRVEAGSWLFREGDVAGDLYVVRSGRLRIVAGSGDAGEERVLRELGPGSALGELALLTGSVRSAGARAVRDCEVLAISREAFDGLLQSDAAFGHAIAAELARQLQVSGGLEAPSPSPGVFAVVPLSPGIDAARFGASLARELGRWGSVTVIGLGEADDLTAATVAREEEASDYVVLVGGRGNSAWDALALRQADRPLLLVGPDTRVTERPGSERSDLVLLGPLPTGRTAEWLDAVRPASHHLVYEAAYEIGVARVARRISGRSLGLVLSGGGARCFAHIGVIAAINDAGVEVDRFGGCSMGAYVAGLAALGLDAEQMREQCDTELVRRTPFNDWTLPRVALIRSRKAARMLQRVFGDLQVEELARPLYTVSADLVSSQMVVHRRGPLLEAVGISMSIPGLVPPVQRGGGLLVDGGVLNNLPVDLMHELPEGPILAVDVVRRLEPLSGGVARIPSIVETMTRATLLGSVQRAESNRRLATLVITPDVQDIGLRDFGALERGVAAGYEAATAALAAGGADVLRDALR